MKRIRKFKWITIILILSLSVSKGNFFGERVLAAVNLNFSNSDGKLIISGTGSVDDIDDSLRDDLTSVVIEEGITEIGMAAFFTFNNSTFPA